MEYAPKGYLYDLIHKTKIKLLRRSNLNITRDIATAAHYLHSKNLPQFRAVLSSRSVLLFDNYRAKLGDFGISKHLSQHFVIHRSTSVPGKRQRERNDPTCQVPLSACRATSPPLLLTEYSQLLVKKMTVDSGG
jgi:serine/threonine protein kinase